MGSVKRGILSLKPKFGEKLNKLKRKVEGGDAAPTAPPHFYYRIKT